MVKYFITKTKRAGSTNSWGYDNKEASIRLGIMDETRRVTNFEIKPPDHMGNHYYMMSAVIGAALDGIKNKLKLPK